MRDPSGIIEYHLPLCSFLSLFFSARRWVQTRIGYPPVYACVVTNARARSMWTEGRRRDGEGEVRRQESAHLRSRNAVHLWQSGHYALCPSARRARGLYATRAYVFRPRALCHFFDSRGKRRPPARRAVSKSCERDSVVRLAHECAAPRRVGTVTHRRSMRVRGARGIICRAFKCVMT